MSVYTLTMFLKSTEEQKYLFRHAENASTCFVYSVYPLNEQKKQKKHAFIERLRKTDFLNFYKCINLKVKFETLSLLLELRCTLLEACTLACIENNLKPMYSFLCLEI